MRINSIIAITLVCLIFVEEMAWAAGAFQANCLAPRTRMAGDIEAQVDDAQTEQGQDFGMAFGAAGAAYDIPGAEVVEEFSALLSDNPQLWAILLAATIAGFFCFTLYTWVSKLFKSSPRSKTGAFIGKLILMGTFLPCLSLIRAVVKEGWAGGIVSDEYQLVLLMLGLAAGAYIRYTMGELYGWMVTKVRSARTEVEEIDLDLRLEGWGSGVNSVILRNEMKGVNLVQIPDAEAGKLKVLALGISKSEMKEWAGKLLSAFEKKGHKVKRVIIDKLGDVVSHETHTVISDFKPHVVIIPHRLDTSPLVGYLQSVARRTLETRARDERRGSILIEYETQSSWDIYIKHGLERIHADSKRAKEIPSLSNFKNLHRQAESEFVNHFDTYLYYHSIPKMLTVFLASRAGKFKAALGERLAMRFRGISIASSNASTGVERVRAFGHAKKSDPAKLGGFFAQRFRVTRIGMPQANRNTSGTTRRIGGRLELRQLKKRLFEGSVLEVNLLEASL